MLCFQALFLLPAGNIEVSYSLSILNTVDQTVLKES